MKQNRNRMIWMVAAVAALFVGCSKESELPVGAVYSDVQILPTSAFASDEVVGVPQGSTRAAIDPTKEMTFPLVRADETGVGTGIYNAYGTTPLLAVRAAGAGATALTFATPQYYLLSNARTKLTGWYPVGTSTAGSVVSWTIDGTQEILTLAEQTGNLGVPIRNLVFNHRLAQLQMHPYTSNANMQALWGTITNIEVMDQVNACSYDFSTNAATGALTPQPANTSIFTVGGINNATIPTGMPSQMGDPVMILPQAAATVLRLRVTTSNLGKMQVSLPAGVYDEGKAYVIKLKFNAITPTIDATATVGEWQTVDRSEQEVTPPVPPPSIGDLKNGGIVYQVTDGTDYKIFSLTAGAMMQWAPKDTYVLGAGDGQDVTNGQKNLSAMQAYSAAHIGDSDATTQTTGVFATDFPAAAFCAALNTDGVTGWYLPSKDELLAFYTVYMANKSVLDSALADNGGTEIVDGDLFWSGTEVSNNTSNAWYVDFMFGTADVSIKRERYTVRCIRNI